MNKEAWTWRSILSVSMIIFSLFVLVFIKMEMRSEGYQILKLKRELSQLKENEQLKFTELAKKQRPQYLEELAQSDFTLKRAKRGQIVLLTESRVAINNKEF